MNKIKKLSWDDIDKITDNLASQVKASGFLPDYIIGLTMGGLIPLYFMARKLGNTDNCLTISVNSYNKDKKGDLKILYLPEVNLNDKKILIVDDISGTGDTLKEIFNVMVNQYKVGQLKTATLVVLKDSRFYPDFHALEENTDWIVFPWDKHEFPEYFEG